MGGGSSRALERPASPTDAGLHTPGAKNLSLGNVERRWTASPGLALCQNAVGLHAAVGLRGPLRDAGAEPQGGAGGDAGCHLRLAGRGPGRARAAAAHGAGPGGAAGAGGVGDGRLAGTGRDAGGGPREARLPAGAHRPARGGAGAGEGAVPGGGPGARGGGRAGPAAGLLRHLPGGPEGGRGDGPGRVRPAGLPRAQRRGLAGVPRGADRPGRGRADVPAQRACADRLDQGGARPHARKTPGPDRRHLVRRREGRLPGPGEAGRRRPKRWNKLGPD